MAILVLKLAMGLGFVAARGSEGADSSGWAHTRHFHFDPYIGPWLLLWVWWVFGEFGKKKNYNKFFLIIF